MSEKALVAFLLGIIVFSVIFAAVIWVVVVNYYTVATLQIQQKSLHAPHECSCPQLDR